MYVQKNQHPRNVSVLGIVLLLVKEGSHLLSKTLNLKVVSKLLHNGINLSNIISHFFINLTGGMLLHVHVYRTLGEL